jgi:hypothetical protein
MMGVLFAGSSVFALDMPGFGKKAPSSGGSMPLADLSKKNDEITRDYYAATKHFLTSQELALTAFGLKQEAEKIKAEKDQLTSGNLTKDSHDRFTRISDPANDKIAEKIKAGEKLDAEGQAAFKSSMSELGQGIVKEVPLAANITATGKAAADGAKTASPLDAPKYLAIADVLVPLGGNVVKDLDLARKTLGIYIDYAKSNQIEVPADATAAFTSR